MKRIISVLIFSVMILQPFLAVPEIWATNSDRAASFPSDDMQPTPPIPDRDTRGPITENDDTGGSWFDDLDDDLGIASTEKICLHGGFAGMDWWDLGWTARRWITMNERSGNDLVDHPVLVILNGTNFDYNKANEKGIDIRFATSSGIELNYWIEEWNPAGESRIWLNVSEIPANGETTVGLYYGNEHADHSSNGTSVFDFFEDFDDGEISDWTQFSMGTYGGAANTAASSTESASPPFSAQLRGTRSGSWGTINVELHRDVYLEPGTKRIDFSVKHNAIGANHQAAHPEKSSVRVNDDARYGPVSALDYNWHRNNTDLFMRTGVTKIAIRTQRHGFTTGTNISFDNIRIRQYRSPEPSIKVGEERYVNEATHMTSTSIDLPSSHVWSALSLIKLTPPGSHINVSVMNAVTNITIPGYHNRTEDHFDISNITETSIRLKACFSGQTRNTPMLDSWGVQWAGENGWRDSFVTDAGLSHQVNVSSIHNISVAYNTVLPGLDVNSTWHFDAVNRGVTEDSSGHDNHGAVFGARHHPGMMGGALRFDGLNDHVEVFDSPAMNVVGEITLEAWIKPEDDMTGMSVRGFIHKGSDPRGQCGYSLYFNNSKLFFHTDADIFDSGALSWENQWYHIALTYDSVPGNGTIYRDGIAVNSTTGSPGALRAVPHSLRIGGGGSGYFNGVIDEVGIYSRVLMPDEIFDRSARYRSDASFRSVNITTPSLHAWNVFSASFTAPANTSLELSLHDAKTGDILHYYNGTPGDIVVDISDLNMLEQPSVYLSGRMVSGRMRTSNLHYWAVNWTPMDHPVFIKNINNLAVLEDTPEESVLNLSEHFSDEYSDFQQPVFSVHYISDPSNLTAVLNGSKLDVIGIAENWTGNVTLTVNCTNLYSLSTSSNAFNITVSGVNDSPGWSMTPPQIELDEDSTVTTSYPLSDYVVDSESDEFDFKVRCENEDIRVSLDYKERVTVTAMNDYFGTAEIEAVVYQTAQRNLSSKMMIPVMIEPVNDAPEVILLEPGNNSLMRGGDVTLLWRVTDVDNDLGDIIFNLYFGNTDPTPLHSTGLVTRSMTLMDLRDHTTYHWYVRAFDGELLGECISGGWSFTVDSAVEPCVTLVHPENNAVLNSTEINLTWTGDRALPNAVYHVYLGRTKDTLSEQGHTTGTWYQLEGLEDGTTYWWRVIPEISGIVGKCASGVWNFTLNTSYEVVYNLDIRTDVDRLEWETGDNTTFNISLTNLGNAPVSVTLGVVGPLAEYLVLPETVVIPVQEGRVIRVNITNTSLLGVGDYYLNITISFPGGKRELRIPVKVIEENGDAPDDDDNGSRGVPDSDSSTAYWWWVVIVAAALLLLIPIVFIVIMRRKGKGKEGKEGMNGINGTKKKSGPTGSGEDESCGDEQQFPLGDASGHHTTSGAVPLAEGKGPGDRSRSPAALEAEVEYVPKVGGPRIVSGKVAKRRDLSRGIKYGYTSKRRDIRIRSVDEGHEVTAKKASESKRKSPKIISKDKKYVR